jgi:hypothetical protein
MFAPFDKTPKKDYYTFPQVLDWHKASIELQAHSEWRVLGNEDQRFLWEEWEDEFNNNRYRYLHAMEIQFIEREWKNFRIDFDIPDGEGSEFEWFPEAAEGRQQYIECVVSKMSELRDERQPGEFHSSKKIVDDMLRMADIRGFYLHDFLNEMWFNLTISTSPELIDELRDCKYKNYLATDHWQKVRHAALLIHNARCQEDDCYDLMETWWFSLDSLHIHHLTYKNRGCERYRDLTLLCEAHHRKVHNR